MSLEIIFLAYLNPLPKYVCNQLKGNIPKGIGNFSMLKKLDLNINHFTGGIPVTLANLTKLNQLELSENSSIVLLKSWYK